MILAILSDIHSNLEALEACLAELEKRGIQQLACLGDVVGYGADSQACCDRMRRWPDLKAVAGNHDTAVAGIEDYADFNSDAKMAVEINRRGLSAENVSWLAGLPRTMELAPLFLVHGSPARPTREYVLDKPAMKQALADIQQQICFVGHSHSPFVFRLDAGELSTPEGPQIMALDPDARYLINAGAVGQPRDKDPRACFAVFQNDPLQVEFVRLEYDIARAQKKMREKGIPENLIKRLEIGI